MESQRRIDLLNHAEPDVRAEALALVDELSRPMGIEELEAELVPYYPRSKAREICHALRFFQIVLLRAHPAAPKKPTWSRPGDGPPRKARKRGGGGTRGR